MCMIFLNIGSKYLVTDLSAPFHKALLSSKFMRRLLIFTIVFIATRDIKVSLIITAAFVIIVLNLFNDQSDYCVLPKSLRQYEDLIDENKDGIITKEEIEKAKNLLEKAQKKEKYKNHLKQVEDFSNKL